MAHPVLSMEGFAALGMPYLVYVKPVLAELVMGRVDAAVIERFALEPDTVLYAVHRADGEQLAVLMDKEAAFAAAFAHELAPVSVH